MGNSSGTGADSIRHDFPYQEHHTHSKARADGILSGRPSSRWNAGVILFQTGDRYRSS